MVPESPRWLIKKDRYQAAFQSFCRLRNSELQAARDLFYAHSQIAEEHHAFAGDRLSIRIIQLFSIPRLRRATMASAVCVISQQFSGINIMSFYSSTIFSEAGYGTKPTLLASWGFGFTMFVFAFPAVYTMDTWGRRNLLMFTFPLMAACLAIAGCCFLIDRDNGARVPLIALFVYIFTALYGPGMSKHSMWNEFFKKLTFVQGLARFLRFISRRLTHSHIERLVEHSRSVSTMPLEVLSV